MRYRETAAFAYQDRERAVLFIDTCSYRTGNPIPEGSPESGGGAGRWPPAYQFRTGKEKLSGLPAGKKKSGSV